MWNPLVLPNKFTPLLYFQAQFAINSCSSPLIGFFVAVTEGLRKDGAHAVTLAAGCTDYLTRPVKERLLADLQGAASPPAVLLKQGRISWGNLLAQPTGLTILPCWC